MALSLPTAILCSWVIAAFWTMVSDACIDNPMDAINEKAKRQYQLTDEVLDDMKRSTPAKYAELLRIYGIYRACIEGGTGRWTDNVDGGKSGTCPYIRTKIEDVDKTVTERPQPKVRDRVSCKNDEFCYESPDGCFHYGLQGSVEECKNVQESSIACIFKSRRCRYCTDNDVKTDCPFMCGYCRARCTKLCNKHGIMNHTTCTCSCDIGFSGEQCEKKICPHITRPICRQYPSLQCDMWSKFCPYFCGECDESERPICDDDPACFITQKGCAARRDAVGAYINCTGIKDHSACTNQPEGYTCYSCDDDDVLRKVCPFMCGVCI